MVIIIIDEDTNEPINVNVTEKGKSYILGGCRYTKYHDCTKCKNASWYDDSYCNNQKIHFVEKEGVKTTRVYCESYEV